ncbi:MAG: hypothetical protein AAGG50_17490 [Bacteroidota bacterium]
MIGLVVAGCGDWGPDSVDIWRQRIPGSSVVVYHIDASYNNTVSGSFESGLVIADSTTALRYEGFGQLTPYVVISSVSPGNVQFVTWTEFPAGLRNDTITSRFIQPLPSAWSRIGDVGVENVRYRGQTGGQVCRLHQYEFTRFEERADSLVVYNLTRGDGLAVDRMAFPKGNIKAFLDEIGLVKRLEIEMLITGLHPGYRTSQPLELVDVPTVCVATYWLSHVGPEKQPISDYGVFRPFWSCRGDDAC